MVLFFIIDSTSRFLLNKMCKNATVPAEELPEVEVLHPLNGLEGVAHRLLIQPGHLLKLVRVSAQ